ncbi:MAG: hypothetical protein AMXMBFR13_27800 [Phycisphaerae bacterium]
MQAPLEHLMICRPRGILAHVLIDPDARLPDLRVLACLDKTDAGCCQECEFTTDGGYIIHVAEPHRSIAAGI